MSKTNKKKLQEETAKELEGSNFDSVSKVETEEITKNTESDISTQDNTKAKSEKAEARKAAEGKDRAKENSNEESSMEEKPEKIKPTKLYIIEAVLAVAAVAILVFAIYRNETNKQNLSNSETYEDSVSSASADTSAIVTVDIDNSVLYTDIPEIPSVVSYNGITLEECETALASGTMQAITTADDGMVYVNSFEDADYLSSQVSYTEEELEESIFNELLVNFAEETEPDHDIAANGDTVDIDYVGKIDGKAFEGGSANDQLLLGSNSYIPGFEDGVIGMKAGETKDINVTFPSDYMQTDLAGKDAVFTVSLNEIVSTTVYPQLTEDIVNEAHPELGSVEECRDYYAKLLLEEKIYSYLTENFYVSSISDDVVNFYYTQTMDYYDNMSNSYQISVEDLIGTYGQSLDEFKTLVMVNSTDQSRYSALYEALMQECGLTISDEKYTELASSYGFDDINSFLDTYGEQSVNDYLNQSILLEYLADSIL